MDIKRIKAHSALFMAGCMWGLMSPIAKTVMYSGITDISLVSLRMLGAAILFWFISFFQPKEKVSSHDIILLFFAGVLSIVCNQGLFLIGLSKTSPIDASIITIFLPIITMILAAILTKEKITFAKSSGIIIGTIGALILIISNYSNNNNVGTILGDIICLTAQCCFALYLVLFKKIIAKYSIFTLMKWMFTFATIVFIPFAYNDLLELYSIKYSFSTYLGIGYVVIFGTFFTYMLTIIGQKILRPTIVSMYNYVQPIVGSGVSILMGIDNISFSKIIATTSIFIGVYIVTQSKS